MIVLSLFHRVPTANRSSGDWVTRCGIGLATFLLSCQFGFIQNASAAGCQHDKAQMAARIVGDAEGLGTALRLDESLRGRWEYVGGRFYYVYYPGALPCDGPSCHSAPQSDRQMNAPPTSGERTLPAADRSSVCFNGDLMSWPADRDQGRFCDQPSPDSLLRPPSTAG